MNLKFCEICQQGKQTKLPFQRIKYEESFSLFTMMYVTL